MIRLKQRPLRQRIIAIVAVLGITFTGMPPLLGAERKGRLDDQGALTQFLEVLNRQGGLSGKNIADVVAGRPRTPGRVVTMADIQRFREKLLSDQANADPTVVQRARRALMWLRLATATTAADRHDLIRQLPVTITVSAPTDGRAGFVENFVVRGKTRFRLFIPNAGTHSTVERSSGPSVLDQDPVCYDDYQQESPCATEQDLEDAAMAAAELDAQIAEAQAEIDALGPEEGEQDGTTLNHGPCTAPSCAEQAGNAAMALLAGAATVVTTEASIVGAAVGGVVVASGATVAGWMLSVFAAGFAVGYTAGAYIACRQLLSGFFDQPFDLPLVYQFTSQPFSTAWRGIHVTPAPGDSSGYGSPGAL